MGRALDAALQRELDQAEEAGRRRRLAEAGPGPREREFTSNDVLGLAGESALIDAGRAALAEYGAGGRASRLLGGGCPLDARAEAAAAAWLGERAALLFPSGYQANLGLIGALAGPGDALLCDALLHASLVDAARLSRAQVIVHAHADLDALDAGLRRAAGARRRLVLTEGVFSMDGDIPPLAEIAALCARHDAHLLVDEAHAAGVLGPRGAGAWAAAAAAGELPDVLAARLVTGGKALGVSGAFVVGSAALRELLVNRARSFVFTTATSPAVPGALLAAIARAQAADAERAAARLAAARLAAALGLPAPAATIVSFVLGEDRAALAAAERCRQAGFEVRAVRPPTVPEGSARLRLACHAFNTPAAVDELAALLRSLRAPQDGRAHGDGPAGGPRRAHAAPHAARAAPLLCVAGTDTDVGKTVASALLLRAAARAGLRPAYWKPVQTGADSDTGTIGRLVADLDVLRLPPHAEFPLAASPHEAAAAAGAAIDVAALQDDWRCAGARAAGRGLLVVELAGGLLVPLDARHTQADLLARLRPALVLVARSGLGTLNHTLLTLEALASRGLRPRALLLVGPPHRSNAATLAARTALPLLQLPRLPALDAASLDAWLDTQDLSPIFDR